MNNEDIKDESVSEVKAPKKNKKAIALLVGVILIVGAIAGYLIVKYVVPMGEYDRAESYAEEGKLSEAIELYKNLGNYRDSEELYYKYVEEYARELVFNNKDYKKAEELLGGLYTEDDDLVMLLGYARSAINVEAALKGDENGVKAIEEMVMDDYISGVYSYAEVCLSNKEYEKAKILINALLERNYRDTKGLYEKLLENDVVARAKTPAGFKDYAQKFMQLLTDDVEYVKFVDENNDGVMEMLLLDKEDKLKTISYTGEAEVVENKEETFDKESFITTAEALEILEEKLIIGITGNEEVIVTDKIIDENKLVMQNMIDYERNKNADGEMWVNSYVDRIYEMQEGVYYVKYTYAMRFGKVNLPSTELRDNDFTKGEYLQKYENELNELYGYAIFGENDEGESKYYLGKCSAENEMCASVEELEAIAGEN